ncbi:MAG: ABC transporter ATP-binding protein/permease [Paludibacteraceae bacterium]|nr:ABC transporter ATP-binding protein/permease [Paludibacteraceae bacterium]
MQKNKSVLQPLLAYAGKRKWLMYLSMGITALGQLLALAPFICIWLILRDVITVAPNYSEATHLVLYGWLAVGFAIASIFVYCSGLMCSHLVAFRVAANMRKAMMKHIMTLPIGFLDSLGSGKVRKWVQETTESTENYLAHQTPDRIGAYATIVGLAGLMFGFDWRMGLLCLSTAVLALMVIASFMTGESMKKQINEYCQALDSMSNEAVEYVRGTPVIKTFGQSVFSFKRFKQSIDKYETWVIAYTRELQIPMSLYIMLVNASFALLIAFTLIMAKGGTVDGIFLLNLLYYIIITPSLAVVLNRLMFVGENEMIAAGALDKVNRILAIDPLKEPEKAVLPDENEIELHNVRFRYPEAERFAVDGISMHIPSQQKIAFVGPSGGGKTTTASLIARFFDVTEGSITLGGVDIRNIPKRELMNRISFVFQDSRLLKTSILENVRLGRPTASREEVMEALHNAQCDDIIAKLPDGIDTIIGTKGTYLSGGEQQRISIARVMLKNTPIVILDEATAFADPDNEVRVQEAFSRMAQSGKTLIMVAHRLSSITGADCIYVLENGRISESGDHQTLVKKGGQYAAMWKQYNESIKWNIK